MITVILIGAQFALFVGQLEAGKQPFLGRPPGIEAFLPISSLISLKYWLVSGEFNRIHPSGLIILLAALATALFIKRGFCSWVCPFGLLTEYFNRLHKWLFRRSLQVPRWLDIPFRSLKYLLLAFFLWAIIIKMDSHALEYFIYSPYNMVADIKMLHFFSDISPFAFWTIVILAVLSVLVRNFWCRYLCPYGALLGVVSLLSVFKIHRNEATCTRCRQCTHNCPVDIAVHTTASILSDECHACLKCVSACPERDTLYLSTGRRRGRLAPWALAALVILLFAGGPFVARLGGYWQNDISVPEYRFHVRNLQRPLYQHNRGSVPSYDLHAWRQMLLAIRAADPKNGSSRDRGPLNTNRLPDRAAEPNHKRIK